MEKFTRKDFYFSVITGFYTGFIGWQILVFLELPEFAGISYVWLVVLVPVLWILGVNLGYFLGRWLAFFNQFGKFSAVGFTNAAVYFGILNLLITFYGVNRGIWYSLFVALAFTIGTIHSYFWNKFWVFSQSETDLRRRTDRLPLAAANISTNISGEQFENKISGQEFGKFLGVSMVTGLINVGTASFVVNILNPMFGMTFDQWANMGGIAGSAVALMASFIGFKLAVFRK